MACVGVALVACAAAPQAGLYAQENDRCWFLCAPELKIEPTITFEPIFRRPVIAELEDGEVVTLTKPGRETVFEVILSLGIPTTIPRVSFTFETIFIPFGDTEENPFTGTTAAAIGRTSIRDNEIEVEFELNLGLIEPGQTGGWIESHFDIVDKFSPAARPGDGSVYTHKLNFEWDTAFLVFNWLPEEHYLKHVEIEGSLDYVATGLPQAGDVFGSERFLTDDSPWSFSLVFVFPLAPLSP